MVPEEISNHILFLVAVEERAGFRNSGFAIRVSDLAPRFLGFLFRRSGRPQ